MDEIEFWKGKYFAQKSANTELHKGIRRLKAVEKRLNEDLVSLSEEANRVIEDIECKSQAWQMVCRLLYGGTGFVSWGHLADEWYRQYQALRPDYQQEGEDSTEECSDGQ
jgi:hypothetical protein